MVKKETDGGEVHVWTLAGWPCGLSVGLSGLSACESGRAQETEQVCCSVLDCMAPGSEGLESFPSCK